MKKSISLVLMFCMLILTLMLSGCLPPNYSKEKAKEIAKTHQKEVLAWFSANMPDAKPDSDCEAYETGVNLLGAVKGSYKRNGKSYRYAYEYTNKKMYIGEGYEESCKIVEDMVLKDFGYTKQETEVSFHGYQFAAKNENDDPKAKFRDEYSDVKEFYSSQEKLRPAAMTPQQFAEAVVAPDTKEKLDFYLHLYRDNFPEWQQEKQKRYKNLGSIWCSTKIDLTQQAQGVYERIYLRDRIEDRYYHIEKIAEGLYGGYISFKGMPKSGDKLKFSYKDGKYLTLEIPKETKPILFSKNSLTLVHYFKNPKGDTIENVAEEMYKSKQVGINGYHQYSTELFVKDNLSYGYTNMVVPYVGGVYKYKLLGILDLDYWRLKFFD